MAVLLAAGAAVAAEPVLRLNLRSRVEAFKGSGEWREVAFREDLPAARAAVIICDMWDRHWCRGAAERVATLAPKAARVVDALRARGVLIIHAPSDTMEFYKDAPQRKRILAFPRTPLPEPLALSDPPLPIDDSDGGCDTETGNQPVNTRVWTRQHAAITIAESDLISDNGQEVYSALKERGITTLLVMGVHTNMCVLNRTFAIRRMTRSGVRCILIRDLTDAMYNPKRRPQVTHEQGTALVIEHIEKYWCPTVLSSDLLR
jgi:nicotinamidase-related amidase